MNKPTILFLFGGESPEHEVSIASAQNIYKAIDQQKYAIILCYIDTKGRWWRVKHIRKGEQQGMLPAAPLLGEGAIEIDGVAVPVHAIYPVLHGQNGEDGTIQGLAELMHVPIIGCGPDSSTVCMNKILAKKLLASEGMPIVPYTVYHATDVVPSFESLTAKLGPVLFVKPARQGSSVGVNRVTSQHELSEALCEALEYDDIILIESGLTIREIEVAVMGKTAKPAVSTVGEIIPDREFYSYASKYDETATSEVRIPAELPKPIVEKIRALAGRVFTTLNCQGMARIDFFIDDKQQIYINEINTLPGFTNISMYPKLWEASGKPTPQLVAELIEQALANKKSPARGSLEF